MTVDELYDRFKREVNDVVNDIVALGGCQEPCADTIMRSWEPEFWIHRFKVSEELQLMIPYSPLWHLHKRAWYHATIYVIAKTQSVDRAMLWKLSQPTL